ncbi:hypothetical protein HJG60_008320 [Phyllostomus discolor]|uniref:Uncharacterized protein n=1 Tax=Phyllostomus discolor TaxID=89673 RepID=A0A834DQ91_9CHIR|nr:hypothetical protein HJG60_008320 [Phyllostomus discolor]
MWAKVRVTQNTSTFQMGVKGFKRNHEEEIIQEPPRPPKPSLHKHSEKRSKQPTCPTANSPSVFIAAADSGTCKIWMEAAFTSSCKPENILCPSPLIPARSALAHYLAVTSSSLVNIYCLSFQDLVLVQRGKLGSEYKSRRVRITRMKHK